MSIDSGYFWFRLFKTRGIGPKLLGSIAKILEAENLTPELLPRNQNDLLYQINPICSARSLCLAMLT